MLAKSWKKILIVILVIACLWNIFTKLSKIVAFDETILSIKARIQTEFKQKNVNVQ